MGCRLLTELSMVNNCKFLKKSWLGIYDSLSIYLFDLKFHDAFKLNSHYSTYFAFYWSFDGDGAFLLCLVTRSTKRADSFTLELAYGILEMPVSERVCSSLNLMRGVWVFDKFHLSSSTCQSTMRIPWRGFNLGVCTFTTLRFVWYTELKDLPFCLFEMAFNP